MDVAALSTLRICVWYEIVRCRKLASFVLKQVSCFDSASNEGMEELQGEAGTMFSRDDANGLE